MPRIIQPPTPSTAQRLLHAPSAILRGIVQGWSASFIQLWGRPIPAPPKVTTEEVQARYTNLLAEKNAKSAEILAELGSEAGPIMEDSTELVGFFLPRLPEDQRGQVLALIASKPPTTTHPDGTVTIDEA